MPKRNSGSNSELSDAALGYPVPGRFSYDRLDRVLHEKARLGILASLVGHPDGLHFNDLKELCALTDGNLSRHLGVLEEAALVEVQKETDGSRPRSLVRLTPNGRERFAAYISELERVIADAHASHSRSNQPISRARLAGE